MSKWEEKRLGELIDVNPETLSLSKYKGSIQYIDIASVNNGRLDGYTEYDISEAPSRARRIIKNDDMIFSTVRPNLRAYYYVRNCPDNAICSTGFAILRAKKEVDSRFIYALHVNPEPGIIPCHRVVNREGKVAPSFAFGGESVQRQLLESEGIVFESDGRIDLGKYSI